MSARKAGNTAYIGRGPRKNSGRRFPMSGMKKANGSIHCCVKSCEHHCGSEDFCSLQSIDVRANSGCTSGCGCDESFCGSYHAKR